jgi:hypothetical protein
LVAAAGALFAGAVWAGTFAGAGAASGAVDGALAGADCVDAGCEGCAEGVVVCACAAATAKAAKAEIASDRMCEDKVRFNMGDPENRRNSVSLDVQYALFVGGVVDAY